MKKYSGKPVYKKSTWQWQAQISFSFHSVDWSGLKNSFPLRDIYAAVLAIRFVSSHFGIHPNSVSVFRIWISSSFFLHFLLNNQQCSPKNERFCHHFLTPMLFKPLCFPFCYWRCYAGCSRCSFSYVDQKKVVLCSVLCIYFVLICAYYWWTSNQGPYFIL